MDLSKSLPGFLQLLDTDRERALIGFRRFVDDWFRDAPPSCYFRVPADDREDMVSEVVLHCIDNDCAKLRQYQPREDATFEGWFAVVATRRILDVQEQRRRRGAGMTEALDGQDDRGAPDPTPDQIASKRELEGVFLRALRDIGRRCRLLLRLKLLEFKNREIVQIMRLPKSHNKRVGNQVIECRRKLVRALGETGYFGSRRTGSG